MSESVTIYSFGDNDRGGKVRWVARELGLEVDEQRVGLGAHREPPYTDINPLAQIPTVKFRGEVLMESTATCHTMAEAFDAPKLWIGRGEPDRQRYLFWLAAFAETLEQRLVQSAISKIGILGPEYFALHEQDVRFKLGVLAPRLPAEGYLCSAGFGLADVVAGYNLRLAVQCGLVARDAVEPYLSRLCARPAAEESRVFSSLRA